MTDTTELTQFLNFILTGLAGEGNFSIDQEIGEGDHLITYHIQLDSSKAGYVIGKQGRTINAIRRLLQVKAAQSNQKVYLQIISDNQPQPKQDQEQPASQPNQQSDQLVEAQPIQEEDKKPSKTDKQVDELAELLEV